MITNLLRLILQSGVILLVWTAGEQIGRFIPLPVPGSILGMLILLILLQTGLLPENAIRDAGDLFLKYLPFFFVPAGVSILAYLDVLEGSFLLLFLTLPLSTFLVMAVTGRVVQHLILRENRHE